MTFLSRKPLHPLALALIALAAWTAPPAFADLCAQGKAQSPINIRHAVTQKLPPLVFSYQSGSPAIANDTHTARVRVSGPNRLRIGDQVYRLEQVHFHSPAGEQIEGEDFAMAAHLLHKGTRGELLALEVLYRLGAPDPALQWLLPLIPAQADGDHRSADWHFDPALVLPATRGYYRYTGSVTAPPCTQGVVWVVMKEVRTVSAEQLAAYQQHFAPQARGVQAMNGRTVVQSP